MKNTNAKKMRLKDKIEWAFIYATVLCGVIAPIVVAFIKY